jgi:hypothetical protein
LAHLTSNAGARVVRMAKCSYRSIRIADMRGLVSVRSLFGSRAADFFHPNERGYATIVRAFAAPLGIRPAAA